MKAFRLEFLNAGEYFEVVGLEKSFRNLCVRRVTDCSVTVEGDRLEGEAWIPIRATSFSCGTPVVRLNKPKKLVDDNKGGEAPIAVRKASVVETGVKRGRGRPKGSKNRK